MSDQNESKPIEQENTSNLGEQAETPKGGDPKGEEQGNQPRQYPNTNNTNIDVNTIQGDSTFNNAQTINQHYNLKIEDALQFFMDSSAGLNVRFSKALLRKIESTEIEAIASTIQFLTTEIIFSKAREKLQNYGFLLLIGKPKSSIREIAIQIAGSLQKEQEVYICEPLDKQTRINFDIDIPQMLSEQSGGALIFKDPVKKRNIDFSDLFARLSSQGDFGLSIEFIKDLKIKKRFLILTTDTDIHSAYTKIKDAPYALEIDPPSLPQKEEYLDHLLDIFFNNSDINLAQKEIIENQAKEISQSLKYIADIEQFMIRLGESLRHDHQLVLDQAFINRHIRSVSDLKAWLSDEIANDLQSWSFVLALALLSSIIHTNASSISLVGFELFRMQLEEFIRKHYRLKAQENTWTGVTRDSSIFELHRATKYLNIGDEAICIKFTEEGYSSEVWRVLIEEHSFTLIHLVPFLLGLIERNVDSHNSELYTAAALLGRIGEINPGQTLSQISEWSFAEDKKIRALVGHLFHGIQESGNEQYIKRCEQLLDKYSESDNHQQVWTSIVAYKAIGQYKLEYAIQRLGEIVRNKLVPPYELIKKLQTRQSWSFNKLQIFSYITVGDLKQLIGNAAELEEKAFEYKHHDEIFRAVTYSISALCITLDPLSVFGYCQKWLDEGNGTLKVIFLKMLLTEGGVMDQLDRRVSYYNEESKSFEDWHYMVLLISLGERASQDLIEFLQKVVDAFQELDMLESRISEDRLVAYLAAWAESSLQSKAARKCMVDFSAELLSKIPKIEIPFQNQLKNWENSNRLELKTLATEIRNAKSILESKAKETVKINVEKWKM